MFCTTDSPSMEQREPSCLLNGRVVTEKDEVIYIPHGGIVFNFERHRKALARQEPITSITSERSSNFRKLSYLSLQS